MKQHFTIKSILFTMGITCLATQAYSSPVGWPTNFTEVGSVNVHHSAKAAIANVELADEDAYFGNLVAHFENYTAEGKIIKVNSWVNKKISFVEDIDAFGVAERWSRPSETLRSGRGDCEDYALLKMKMLANLGVPLDDMYILIAEERGKRYHAVLLVRVDGEIRLLDNRTNDTVQITRMMNQARYALGVRRSYKFRPRSSAFDQQPAV